MTRIEALRERFLKPRYPAPTKPDGLIGQIAEEGSDYGAWLASCVEPHRVADYAVVHVSLKLPGRAPGDITAGQMDRLADLAERYSSGEIRSTIRQNLVLPHVANSDLPQLWQALRESELATPNTASVSDMVVCPGLDFCSLANASSIPPGGGNR